MFRDGGGRYGVTRRRGDAGGRLPFDDVPGGRGRCFYYPCAGMFTVIAGEKAPPLRAGMNRRHLSQTSESAGLAALGTLCDSSDAARPRPYRDNRTNSESPTEARWYPTGTRRVPTQNQVPLNPPTHARIPEETTGTAVSRIGVTATWHGLHLVGVRTLNTQPASFRFRRWESSPFSAGRMSRTIRPSPDADFGPLLL